MEKSKSSKHSQKFAIWSIYSNINIQMRLHKCFDPIVKFIEWCTEMYCRGGKHLNWWKVNYTLRHWGWVKSILVARWRVQTETKHYLDWSERPFAIRIRVRKFCLVLNDNFLCQRCVNNVLGMSSDDLLIWRNFEFWSTNICFLFF